MAGTGLQIAIRGGGQQDAVDAYVVSEELDGRNATADADRLLLHAANARTLLTTVLDLHHNAPRVGG